MLRVFAGRLAAGAANRHAPALAQRANTGSAASLSTLGGLTPAAKTATARPLVANNGRSGSGHRFGFGFAARALSGGANFDKGFFENAFSAMEGMTPEQMREQARLLRSADAPAPMRAIPLAKRQEIAGQLEMLADNPAMMQMLMNQVKNADAATLNKAFDMASKMAGGFPGFGGGGGGGGGGSGGSGGGSGGVGAGIADAAANFASKLGLGAFGGGGGAAATPAPPGGAEQLPGSVDGVEEVEEVEEVVEADEAGAGAGGGAGAGVVVGVDPAAVGDMGIQEIVEVLVRHGVDFADCLDIDSLRERLLESIGPEVRVGTATAAATAASAAASVGGGGTANGTKERRRRKSRRRRRRE